MSQEAGKFKPFWVKSVNNWITDADYNGKKLKERNPLPTFRQFWFIRSWEDLKGFTVRKEISNEDSVKILLKQAEDLK
jgi:hypothetical protein